MDGRSGAERVDGRVLVISHDVNGAFVLTDSRGGIEWRLRRVSGTSGPLAPWWVVTGTDRFRIEAEGRRNDWVFVFRDAESNLVALARRRNWRLGIFDISLSDGGEYQMRSSLLRATVVRDQAQNEVVSISLGATQLGWRKQQQPFIKTWGITSPPLLLLCIRIELFQASTRPGVTVPGSGG